MTQDTASNGQTQALTPFQQRAMVLREGIGQDAAPRAIVPRTFAEAQAFAVAIAQSALVPEKLRDRAPDVLMIVLAGAELEIPPIRALSLFHVIEGVPKLSADGIAGVVMANPLCEYLEPREQSDERVTWAAKKRGRPELVLSWTKADADRAGLFKPTYNGKPSNHTKYPRQMLNARCKADLCRLVWPEVCSGLVSAEEARDMIELQLDAPSPSSTFSAPPPPPPPAAAGPTTPATTAPASSSKGKSGSKSASKTIDTTATEPSTSTSTSSPPPSTPGASTTQTSGNAGSPTTSTASPSASSTTSSGSSPASPTVADAPSSSSVTEPPPPSVPAEDESGFGDDETPEPQGKTIEQFEAELAAAVAAKDPNRLAAIKAAWLPWSKEEGPGGGKAHALRMRQGFSKAQTDLGIK